MTDNLTPRQRSHAMSRVRSTDTSPERRLRSLIHHMGYRFRLHRRDLPGRPDLAFPSRRKVIFVHGCFWHQHQSCGKAQIPRTRRNYWQAKLTRNVARDARVKRQLRAEGWKVLVVWECQLANLYTLSRRIRRFLEDDDAP